ncbi:MAG: DsrE family protein [Desulfobacterium sp.]|nr:DsrE family protein [Desulfobacterium sp.]
MDENWLSRYRAMKIGIIFQHFHLISLQAGSLHWGTLPQHFKITWSAEKNCSPFCYTITIKGGNMDFKKLSLLIFIVFLIFVGAGSAMGKEGKKSLFVNLTSNEMNRAAMAVTFSTRIITQKQIPVTIFLNVDGVRLVNRHIPGSTHVSGKTLQQMLSSFMAAGGTVIACPMCMKNVGGMKKTDLLEGVAIGSSDVTWPALFADNTTVLNY